jgi:molecular chaperone GrpE
MTERKRKATQGRDATEPEVAKIVAHETGDPEDGAALEFGIEENELLAAAADTSRLPDAARVEIARLQGEIADLKERNLRALADFENYRRRSEREREANRRFAVSEVLRDLVAVADNFGLALRAGGSVEDLRQGVGMIQRQFGEVLRRWGLREIEALGQPFDPSQHEAVATQEDASVEQPTVAAEHRPGYWLHDRLLRPSLVEVAIPTEKPAAPEPTSPDASPRSAAGGENEDEVR